MPWAVILCTRALDQEVVMWRCDLDLTLDASKCGEEKGAGRQAGRQPTSESCRCLGARVEWYKVTDYACTHDETRSAGIESALL